MQTRPPEKAAQSQRLKLAIQGAVQGVGFRPFVFRLASELALKGWVLNDSRGVSLEVEGEERDLSRFLNRLQTEPPPLARIASLESRRLKPVGLASFTILESDPAGPKSALVLPDIATCPDCLEELFDPSNRRYRYPFINCTHCGPRFSIIEALPYDRPQTTMKGFALCPRCRSEYENPSDRRFHAQPTACPACGPCLELWSKRSYRNCLGEDALRTAERVIIDGKILALKGIGGFQLLVDARNPQAIERLRHRKGRGPKPFAMMCPSLGYARSICRIDDYERRLLLSPAAPIVLLRKRSSSFEAAAPDLRDYGVMLPYSPLHHLLMFDLGSPIVATSGNRAEEPICTENADAIDRLSEIADAFLAHNRPIARHVDDSIARVILGREQLLRRARGYAPLPLQVGDRSTRCLAVGAHLKNAVALLARGNIFSSQHIGDLETVESYHAFEAACADLPKLFDATVDQIAHDTHPDYLSTHFARSSGSPCIPVQHHLAHVYSCMAENELRPPVLGFSWDGTGLGEDHSIWGGEAFLIRQASQARIASIRAFPLLGGDAAAKQPRRVALALLEAAYPEGFKAIESLPALKAFTQSERLILQQISQRPLNPLTSSMGRLFDGISSILGICQMNEFEGQAAMLLESAASKSQSDEPPLPYRLEGKIGPNDSKLWILDWRPLIRECVTGYLAGQSSESLARRFHQTLAAYAVAIARHTGARDVALSGGCMQNRLLCERIAPALAEAGFEPHFHQRIPPNDGGICVGQAYAASRTVKSQPPCA